MCIAMEKGDEERRGSSSIFLGRFLPQFFSFLIKALLALICPIGVFVCVLNGGCRDCFFVFLLIADGGSTKLFAAGHLLYHYCRRRGR